LPSLIFLAYGYEHTELIEPQETAYQAELDEAYRLYGNKD
jgi:hypothetical protein